MRKLLFILTLLVIGGTIKVAAQEGGYNYLKETKWGINKNTSGGLIGGVMVKHSIAMDDRMFHTFGVELVNITHPNELRLRNVQTQASFKLAKQNYLYSMRLQYGRDLVLFRKAPQQGAQVIAMLAGGPSLGFLTPYYIALSEGNVKYDPNQSSHKTSVLGPGRLFQGLGEAKMVIGANIKAGISFEFGVFKNNVTGFEAGFLLDAYTEKMIIVDGADQKNFFPTSFITIFWGSRK